MILDKICVYICICNIVLLHSITSKFTQMSVASEYFIRVRRYTTIIHLTPFRTRNQTRDIKKCPAWSSLKNYNFQIQCYVSLFAHVECGLANPRDFREILLRSLPFLSFKRDFVNHFLILLNLPALEFYTEWLSKGSQLGAA